MEVEGTDGANEWETCVVDEAYEINVNYPHQLRKKATGNIIAENETVYGYIRVCLNLHDHFKHRLIALQFIPNPENLPAVDHVNHIRSDNRIENLRWISNSNNCRNKSVHKGVEYTFVDEISPEAIRVTHYNDHEFDDLYYYNDQFFYFNGIQYRVLHIIERANGNLHVNIMDTQHRFVSICYSVFKRMYDLI
jgi:hypothetical protein